MLTGPQTGSHARLCKPNGGRSFWEGGRPSSAGVDARVRQTHCTAEPWERPFLCADILSQPRPAFRRPALRILVGQARLLVRRAAGIGRAAVVSLGKSVGGTTSATVGCRTVAAHPGGRRHGFSL